MTLIVAGYRQDNLLLGDETDFLPDRKHGIFIVADSLVSTLTSIGRQPLLSEFRKVIEVPIQLWEPHFVGEHFSGYKKVFFTYKCLIAFAGSTLVAQHVVNNISGHLAKLRIDYTDEVEFKCVVRKSCDENNLIKAGFSSIYDDDIFVSENDYRNLLSAEFVADVVEHSINKAFESKMKHVIDEQALNAMKTEIILALTCPTKGRDFLYKFHFKTKDLPEGGVIAYCEKELILADSIAVIGMERVYGANALKTAKKAIQEGPDFQKTMREFVVECVRGDRSFEIGFPVSVKTIRDNKVDLDAIIKS
ncbi:hypothetical protein [Rheinheimera tangshanensis]|uniref:Uncharacterized protein n=1 Tax=Rheinheimera tangshanensis TaxID=400153 RepID=A0A5C8M5S2_9GAMM|nr:hypothetical protein [Rheinheimera tangshanensis]TXK83289.1 hypothetical protein FU839_03170 [Rheinheimera tangshanensis]GGM44784.1 hypothetical protein GCM10010920_01330 [Rheinheimera tangshanensis]